MQGLAFLTKYRQHSPKDARSQEEVEYNFGRAFHGLGVPHLAVKHYEMVLALVKQRMAAAEFPEASPLLLHLIACEADTGVRKSSRLLWPVRRRIT